MSIQLPDGTAIGNWSPGWEKNLPKWYTEGYESGLFNESNNWGGDFFPQYRGGKKIPAVIPGGSSMVPGYPSRQTSPSLGNRIEDFLSTLPKAPGSPGERRIPYYDDNWNAGGSGRTNPVDSTIPTPGMNQGRLPGHYYHNDPWGAPNKGFWDQVVPMKDGGSIQRLPLDPPSSNRRKGFPTGIKPSDMSWEDWYGQWGMKPLPGRISRDESPWGSNWEGSIKYL